MKNLLIVALAVACLAAACGTADAWQCGNAVAVRSLGSFGGGAVNVQVVNQRVFARNRATVVSVQSGGFGGASVRVRAR
jgi:hypothetical protein